ncbi:MAG: hypothetical protein QXD32_05805 [Nitrososphaerota archaeon]
MKLLWTAVLTCVVAGFLGIAVDHVLGLEGPSLYIYPEQSVYSPGSLAVFRVLAVSESGEPASGVSLYVAVYGPDEQLVAEYEGSTDSGGGFIFNVFLGSEGVYRVSVEDVGSTYRSAATYVLACASCPQQAYTTTVSSTVTTTVVEISTSTTTATVLAEVTTTILETTTIHESRGATSTVFVTRSTTNLLTTTVSSYATVSVVSTVPTTLTLPGQTVTTTLSSGETSLVLSGVMAFVLSILLLASILYALRIRRRSG